MTNAPSMALNQGRLLEYTSEHLDRSTGDLVTQSLGEFITVTELGEQYGKGPKEVRVILHHMGLLAVEGAHGRYRLAPFAVNAGYGKRLKPKKSNWPFDVLSPKGQNVIAAAWHEAVQELANERAQFPAVLKAESDLRAFSATRGRALETQEAVSWLKYYHGGLNQRQMASVLSVSEQLVGRYVKTASEQRDYHERAKGRALPSLSLLERLEASCSPERAGKLGKDNGGERWVT